MESRCLVFLIFVLLAVLVFAEESYARTQITDEDYWKAVWPNTAIPKPLQDFLKPVSFGVEHMKQNATCSTIFFSNDEIYPGKTMTIDLGGPGEWSWTSWKAAGEELCVQKGPSIEDKKCAKSLRTVMDYVISKLGKNVKPLVSSLVNKQDQYRVEGVTNIGQKIVTCHRLNSQKVMFYCHEVHGTTAYSVPVVASDGTKAQALAVCHFDTSGIDKKSIRQVMKDDPGMKPICHFFGTREVLWVPN